MTFIEGWCIIYLSVANRGPIKDKEATIMYYGYHRTSTKEQHLDRGLVAINEFAERNGLHIEKIFTDQQTGKNFDRPRYTVMKEDVLREGDVLIIKEFDRLGRNKQASLRELRELQEMGVKVVFLDIPTSWILATGNVENRSIMEMINNILIEVYSTIAQQEVERKETRQAEGIRAMKDRGEWEKYGRPQLVLPDNFTEIVARWRAGEMKTVEAIKILGMKTPTFYKKVKEMGL